MTDAANLSMTRLIKAPEDFRVEGKPAGRMPMIVNVEEGLVVSLQAFVLECVVRVGDASRTLEKKALVLCQWYDYLRGRGVSLFEAHEGHLRDFLLAGGRRHANVLSIRADLPVIRSETNLYKCNTISSFYDFWENNRGGKLRKFRGGSLAELKENVLERVHRSIGRAQINFCRPERLATGRRRATPTEDQCAELLTRILSRRDQKLAETYYLIARLGFESGPRAGGIAGLYVSNLLQALGDEVAFKRLPDHQHVLKNYIIPANCRSIKKTLIEMGRQGRQEIFCQVTNKGGGWIEIPIKIDLLVEIFDYMCTTRQEIIRERFVPGKKAVPDNLFLSYKAGALRQESISNYFNALLKAMQTNATFHKLRAAFAQKLVREAYREERRLYGSAWQAQNVLEYARRRLGHKSTSTLRHYLDNIISEEKRGGEAVYIEKKVDAQVLRSVAEALGSSRGEKLRVALEEMLQNLAK